MGTRELGDGRVWIDQVATPARASLPSPAAPAASVTALPPAARPRGGYLAPFTVDVDAWDAWPLTRDAVWLIPAVAQGIQVIAGTIGTLPLGRYRGRDRLELGTMLSQPDPEEPREATLTRLVEDLVLFPYAYLVVLERDRDGFPLRGRYVPAELVEPADDVADLADAPAYGPPRRYRIGPGQGTVVPARDVMRFPSHWPGLLVAGARALRTAALLEAAAQRFAVMDVPAMVMKNNGADLAPDKVDELLATYEAARRTRTTAYTNALVDLTPVGVDANGLQLIDARRWSTAEVSRLLNLPPTYLNAETLASQTYSNVEQRRRDLIDLSLRPYLAAVEKRLSLDDVIAHGQRTAFDLDAFYRGDLAARGAYYSQAVNGPRPWVTVDEVRAAENLAPDPSLSEGGTVAEPASAAP